MKYYFLGLGTLVAVCVGCAVDGQQVFDKGEYHAPPAAMLAKPGPMVDGPGPGVLPPMAAPAPRLAAPLTTQVRFLGPEGMQVGWLIPGGYAENQIIAPGRYNFLQGATFRLKITGVPGRPGLVLYPTLQVYPSHPTTDAYLAHNSVPLQITPEDLDQIESNNFVTKVIYLPDARFQDIAIAGVETLVSTRLDPGVDPVAEADRRGTIMAILRIGNMDLEMPGLMSPGPAPGGPDVQAGVDGRSPVQQVSYMMPDGEKGQHMPPLPIAFAGPGTAGIPGAVIAAGHGLPGMPPSGPIAGMGPTPVWGQPITGTPIGLPGPTHLPYGGPAGLQSHTMRNISKNQIPKPVEDVLIDVEHNPPLSMPEPVRYIHYKENHPVYAPEEVMYPRFAQPPTYGPGAGNGPGAGYCPPGGYGAAGF